MSFRSSSIAGVVLALACLAACQTTTPESSPAALPAKAAAKARQVPAVRAETVLPESFEKSLASKPGGAPALVPRNMIAISEVTRPRAEVRSGPGVQFDLTDLVLPQGSRVVVFEQVGVWRQVLVPPRFQRGWIHHQALSEAKLNHRAVQIDLGKLPTVLALRPVATAATFPREEPLQVAIPKGAIFRSLMLRADDALVWLPETNSVMWIPRKDVR